MVNLNEEFVQACKKFAEDYIRPHYEHYDRVNENSDLVHAQAQKENLIYTALPKELGGRGESFLSMAYGGIEFAKVCAATAFSLGFNHGSLRPILSAGSSAQKERFITNLIKEKQYCSVCLTEKEQSGSNLFEIQSTAYKTQRGWKINGQKCMVGNGRLSSQFVVLAKAIQNGLSMGPALFVVPKKKGVEIGPNNDKLGFRTVTTPTISFTDVEVDDFNLIGKLGFGTDILTEALEFFRFGGGIVILGMIEGCLQEVVPWLEERKVFGGIRLKDKSHIQLELGQYYSELKVLKSFLFQTAAKLERGERVGEETSTLKLLSSELSLKVTQSVMQMYGWRGIDNDYPIQKRFRDARQTTIFEGSSEVQKLNLFYNFYSKAKEGVPL
jgi:alkylation response protein AidB-like acyl-CoA dehydrogenase